VTRLLLACALALSSTALAQTETKPAPSGPQNQAPADNSLTSRMEKEQLRRELMDDVRKELAKQKEEVRDEVRAQMATQSANRTLEEEFQFHEERKKLELFEIDGYLRLRPSLFYKFDLGQGTDPNGFAFFPTAGGIRTHAQADMRWRLEPTLNVSEDVRIHSQIDVFDRLVLGATPDGAFSGINDLTQLSIFTRGQASPSTDRTWGNDAVAVKRVYGEVTTPLGQLLFGRMGSQWGLGMLANSGNCEDCDFGDTVDRVMFVSTKVAEHYIVPMIDFVWEGPTSLKRNELFGQPFDLMQQDDARDYAVAVAKRDTDLEINRKLGAGQEIFNYGLYFIWRTQRWDSSGFFSGNSPYGGDVSNVGLVRRDANLYTLDLWGKYQTKRLRLELEIAGIYGKIGNAAQSPDDPVELQQGLTVQSLGAVAQGDYMAIENLHINLELGFASGDTGPGFGFNPGRTGTVQKGMIDGSQFCLAASCGAFDNKITNFRFNPDYRVDLILFREILGGITDAIYVKPGLKYEVTEGLSIFGNAIYSRAVYPESTPSAGPSPDAKPDGNLGIELDAGARYDSGDGFIAGVSYGILFPLSGLKMGIPAPQRDLDNAQTVRGWLIIKY
jgi:uncharacterized protein (TIGR04551 family)